MPELSVIIPARNELFLARTIEDVLEKMRADTELIVVLDGYWPDPPIVDHPKVTLVHHTESIGQRAATNEGVRISQAKYVMKLDAHCALDEGFDAKLMADCPQDWTVVPRMYNLHAFDWVCQSCGVRVYQGPEPDLCSQCHQKTMKREIVWKAKPNPTTDAMRFDRELHFQYWPEFKRRPEQQGDLVPTMSFIGACFLMHRERYWELDGLDERHGSWGQVGTEIACKTWLSDGQLMVNKKTHFAHMFRTQAGFCFPYPTPDAGKARRHSKWLWCKGNWPKAKHDLQWLIDKFAPVPDWEPPAVVTPSKTLTKGIVYYTDNRLGEDILEPCRRQLLRCVDGFKVVTVGLNAPAPFGDPVVVQGNRCTQTMFRQILAGLEKLDTDVVFLCEHDVLYHPSHFEFTPPKPDVFYYNENFWNVRTEDGHALFYVKRSVSGLCAYRQFALEHYRRRVQMVEEKGFTMKMGYEPGAPWREGRVDRTTMDGWRSTLPGIDIKHGRNHSYMRWKIEEFRRKPDEWQEADEVPGWGRTKGRFKEFLDEVKNNC